MTPRPTTSPQQPVQNGGPDRCFWIVAAILTTMLSIGMAQLLLSCHKSQKEPSSTIMTPVDTTRQRLEQKLNAAKDTARKAHQRTSQTKQPYENAAADYTAVRDSLLHQ